MITHINKSKNCSNTEHILNLEEQFGNNVSCECEDRTKLLIDYGVCCIQDPEDLNYCMFSCRKCQYDRMMKNPNYTFRL
jgi:hypothetical protein